MVWSRLKAWLFGESESEAGAEAEPTPERGEPTEEPEPYRCAVCGTEVDGPGTSCPLCGATDVERAGEASTDAPEPAAERVRNEGDDPAERLKETKKSLLARHEERWERDGEGYRVRDADGEWHRVEDEDAVRAVLRK